MAPAELTLVPGFDVLQKALTWPDRARAIAIVDADSYRQASELLLAIKALRKEADETFDPISADAHRAWKTSLEQKRKVETPLTEAERVIKDALVRFDDEQERLRQAEQRRLEADAREREQAEALERAAAMEREGKAWGDDGLVTEAAQIVEEAIQAPAPVAAVQKQTPKVDGINFRKTWKFRITDPTKVPREFLVIDEAKIRGVVRALGSAANIPGVQVYPETTVAAGGRR